MTKTLSNVASKEFHDVFISKYGAARKLQNTSQVVTGVIGESYQWPIIGQVAMQDRGAYGSSLVNQESDHTKVITTFNDKYVRRTTDIFEQKEVNASEQDALAKQLASTIGRYEDQVQINALNGTSATEIDTDSSNLTVEKLIAAKERLIGNNAPEEDMWFIMHANQWAALMSSDKVTSDDYSFKALMDGKINSYLGFNIVVYGDSVEGGLPKTGNIRKCFAWHKDAVGLAYSMAPTTKIWYSDDRASWVVDGMLRMGGSAILDDGIVPIKCDETK